MDKTLYVRQFEELFPGVAIMKKDTKRISLVSKFLLNNCCVVLLIFPMLLLFMPEKKECYAGECFQVNWNSEFYDSFSNYEKQSAKNIYEARNGVKSALDPCC